MEEFSEIPIQQVGLKWRSKREVYNILITEGGCYLPPLADSNYKYISQVLVGDKKVIKWKDVKVCSVPHLKGLAITELIEFTLKMTSIFQTTNMIRSQIEIGSETSSTLYAKRNFKNISRRRFLSVSSIW